MVTIKINTAQPKKDDIDSIAEILKRGKVILYPTDTIYGLGCLATSKKGIMKINKIKQRNASQPMLILASSLNMAKKYSCISIAQKEYLKKVWPGPVTVILESKKNLPRELFGASGYAAGQSVRLPKNKFLNKIIAKAGAPIVSTSANLHGQRNIIDTREAKKIFKKAGPDFIIDGGVLRGKPSRLADIRDIEDIKILRP